MIATVREHTFFRRPLHRSSYVLDLGANCGEFAREVAHRFGVECIAVEPNSDLAARIEIPGVRVRRLAITEQPGDVVLNVAANSEESSVVVADDAVRVETVRGVPFELLLREERVDRIVLAKVDIEGAELAMLMTTPGEVLRRCAQFSVEFHAFTGAMTAADISRVVARLDALGFDAIRFSAGHHNWLFFQRDRCGLSAAEVALTRYLLRNIRGAAVRAARELRRGWP